ncbi:MAG: sigma-70 family RNA polymerase sigma factor [Phycisphaerae bacterium]
MILNTECRRDSTCPAGAATDESALLVLVRRGDESACAEFVRRSGGAMLAVARRFFGCEQEAEDAVQDAFLSAFRSIHEFGGGSKLSTWLHRIVVNACLMKLRSAKRRPVSSIESLLPSFDQTGHHAQRISAWSETPLERLHANELRAKVRECIDQLPDSHRTVLLLRDIEELDTNETAQRLGITPAAVKVRLHRARQALRTLLDLDFKAE